MRPSLIRFAALLFVVGSIQGQTGEYTLDGGFLVPGVIDPEITSTPAANPSAEPRKGSCTQIYREGPSKSMSDGTRVGDGCVVPVGNGSARIRVNVKRATPTQFDITIEPLLAMPPHYITKATRNAREGTAPSPDESRIPVLGSITPPGLPIHRVLGLEETLDIPVPAAASVVHLRFHLKAGKGQWANSGLEEVKLVSTAPAPLVGTTRDRTGSDPPLRIEGPSIHFQNVQYSFRKFFENQGPRGDLRWVSLPGLGRFVLSLQPLPELGFELAGEVQQNTIRVASGDARFDVVSAKPILDSPEAFRLYVRVEPDDAKLGQVPMIGSVDLEDLQPLPTR